MLETKLVNELKRNFKMKDLGEISSVLGVTIERDNDKNTISLNQQHYILKVLERFEMSECNPVSTPLDPNQILTTEMGPKDDAEIQRMKKYPYQEAIGSLMYAAQLTLPDICYALSMLSKFNRNPGMPHWNAVKRVLRYLKGTINRKLVYRNSDEDLLGFCDADYARNIDDRRSVTGYTFIFAGAAISWCSKGQRTVALSTTEAELMAVVSTCQEALWLIRLECEIFPDAPKHIRIFCDNKSTIHVAINNSSSQQTKHIDVRAKFMREKMKAKLIELVYIPTADNLADIHTKPMSSDKQCKFTNLLGLKINV